MIVYDDATGGPAARAWWVLTWAGAGNVRVLDGGLAAWVSDGQPLVPGPAGEALSVGGFVASAGQLPAVSVDELQKRIALEQPLLLDIRAAGLFEAT